MDKNILSECFADTLLAQTLVPTKVGYNHQGGCFNVERMMKSGRLKDSFALGIIDKDRKDVPYLSEFIKVQDDVPGLILWTHAARPHFFIQICPALESWIMNVCEETGIALEDFGFESLNALRDVTKHKRASEDESLKALFAAIKTKQDHEPVRKLTHWITVLRDKNYQADLNELKHG